MEHLAESLVLMAFVSWPFAAAGVVAGAVVWAIGAQRLGRWLGLDIEEDDR